MKISLVLASLIALAPMATTTAFSATAEAPAAISDDMVTASYALLNITDDALDVATQYSREDGIKGTVAGSQLNDLIDDTKALKRSAVRLSQLLDEGASGDAIQEELDTLEVKYRTVYRASAKVSLQLYSQLKTTEGYFLRTAYTKIRSRYVYLQAQLAN
ncbi:MAG: hypothetical protein H7318_09490 [Oligoflexus sp.]|nr:hypothetical protein [Oligoflexus sp.]